MIGNSALVELQNYQMFLLFCITADVSDVGWDFRGGIQLWPQTAVDCAVQRGLK